MLNIRTEETSTGICTIFMGNEVIVDGLSRAEADALVEAYSREHEHQRSRKQAQQTKRDPSLWARTNSGGAST